MRKKVVVFGAMGMLGRELCSRFSLPAVFDVVGTYNRAAPAKGAGPAAPSLVKLDVTRADDGLREIVRGAALVVNCAVSLSAYVKGADAEGIQNAFAVNSVFPKRLAAEAAREGVRVAHISSDAVFSGRREGPWDEDAVPDPADLYGISKYLGEVDSENVLNIRTSIIGFDPTYKRGLLEWYLGHTPGASAHGYSNYLWQGCTTRQLSNLLVKLAESDAFDECRRESGMHHFCPNEALTKFDLLAACERVFNRGVSIQPAEAPGGRVDRRLKTCFSSVAALYSGAVGLEPALRELLEVKI